MSDAVADSIVVRAGMDTVWDVIADFEAYPAWQDEVLEAEVLEWGDDGWARTVRLVVDAGVVRAVLVLAYDYDDHELRWRLVEGEGVRRSDGAYTLEPLDEDATRVRYRLEIEPTFPLPGALRRAAAQRIVRRALADMKRRAEALADGS